jgi:hypothetical protein
MGAGPTDRELVDALTPAFEQSIRTIARKPYAYATSAPLEELEVTLEDDRRVDLILKVLGRRTLLTQARLAKPTFLYEPRRDIEMYRTILSGAGIGPRFYGAVVDDDRGRYCLILERIRGVELWQVGEIDVWEDVARWLAGFHRRFRDELEDVRRANPLLLDYGTDLWAIWPRRAAARLADDGDPRLSELCRIIAHYGTVIDALVSGPHTLVHGEFYPSNVLVDRAGDEVQVWPVDWEMAATGPPWLDLAALVEGWDAAGQARLVAAYHEALTAGLDDGPTIDEVRSGLDCCRLHLTLQWIGWARDWRPPEAHARDWVGTALDLGERLGL